MAESIRILKAHSESSRESEFDVILLHDDRPSSVPGNKSEGSSTTSTFWPSMSKASN